MSNEWFRAEEDEEEEMHEVIGVIFQLPQQQQCSQLTRRKCVTFTQRHSATLLRLKSQNSQNLFLHFVVISQKTHLFAPNNCMLLTWEYLAKTTSRASSMQQ